MHAYLLFHSLVEVGASTISLATFLFAWNTRRYQNAYLLTLGLSALYVGIFEALHCLAFPGMPVFPSYDDNLAPQLWLSARSLQAVACVMGLVVLGRRVRPATLLTSFAALSAALGFAVFGRALPAAVRVPSGLTPFKIDVEWALAAAFLASVFLLFRRRPRFSPRVFRLLVWQAVVMAGCELLFTLYSRPYDAENLLGHLLLLAGGTLQYAAIVRAGLVDPSETHFLDLTRTRDRLARAQLAGKIATFEWDLESQRVTITGMERVFGVPGDLSGASLEEWRSRIHPEDRAGVDAHLREVVAGRASYEREHRVVWPDGSVHWVAARGELERDARGRPVRLAGVNVEITDLVAAEKKLRESELRFRLALQHAPVSVAAQDRQLRYIWAFNQRMVSSDWMIGKRDEDILTADEVARIAPLKRRVLAEGAELHDQMWLARGSSRIFVDMCWEPIRDEAQQVVGVASATVDLTALKLAEEALRQANLQLAEADRRKTEFLAVLSHELRNPLAPIKSGLYVLEHAAPGAPESFRAQEVIARQVDQLTRLVDDLLDVTRISNNKVRLQKQRLELNDLARRTIDDHRGVFAAAGVDVRFVASDRPVFLDADRNRIAQIVGNLLHNAAKFTPPGGYTTVTIRPGNLPGRAILEVADTGVGMAPETVERLFQPFTQADATLDRSRGGLGLGLALVKGLVELHGGSVTASSAGLGEGSCFLIDLPTVDGNVPALPTTVVADRQTVARRVLVIEDNRDAAEMLRQLLVLAGHDVAVAHDGPAGMAAASALQPDIVFCDIGLPGMNGYEVARAVRANPALRNACLVALSRYALPEDIERAGAAGFHRHMAKPIDPRNLASLLDSLGPAAESRDA